MLNVVLMKRTLELEEASRKLGFTQTLFLGDVVPVSGSKKDLLRFTKGRKKGQILIYQSPDEERLRFALEKTTIDLVYGMEKIYPRDSLHFVRGGLDQVLCKIAAEKGKTIAFSFSDLLNSSFRPQTWRRMAANIRLCRKYKVKMLFSTFASSTKELRSAKDLEAVWRVLGK